MRHNRWRHQFSSVMSLVSWNLNKQLKPVKTHAISSAVRVCQRRILTCMFLWVYLCSSINDNIIDNFHRMLSWLLPIKTQYYCTWNWYARNRYSTPPWLTSQKHPFPGWRFKPNAKQSSSESGQLEQTRNELQLLNPNTRPLFSILEVQTLCETKYSNHVTWRPGCSLFRLFLLMAPPINPRAVVFEILCTKMLVYPLGRI